MKLEILLASVMTVLAVASAAAQDKPPYPVETLKGGIEFSAPPPLASRSLGLLPTEDARAKDAPCGAKYAALPMAIGDRERFAKLQSAAKGAAAGFLSKALSSVSGGLVQSGGNKSAASEPVLYEDPIPKKVKSKVDDKMSGAELRVGGRLTNQELLISTRLDDVKGKGTFHDVYLERDDCRRIYPVAEYPYELWGKWSLSVSWSKTESTSRDGKVVDQKNTSGNFFRSGDGFLDAGTAALAVSDALKTVPPELQEGLGKYQAQLQNEAGRPLWQRIGSGVPEAGVRSAGTVFKLSEPDVRALKDGRYSLVVQVTREHGPFYQAVGVPMTVALNSEGFAFHSIETKKH